MLGFVYEWIENISIYLVIIAAIMHMIPGEDYKKYIKFFVGMILILMLSKPILMIWGLSEFPILEYEKQLQEIKEVMSVGE